MGDVLAYLESPVNDRLLGFARPLADAAGGDLVALVAGAEPGGKDASAADVVLEAAHPALSPYLPEAHQAVLAAAINERSPDLVVLENTTAGLDLGAAAAAATGRPFVGYCVELAIEGGEARSVSGIYGGQHHATANTRLPAVFAINSLALHDAPQAAARGARGPEDDVRRAGGATRRGRRPDEGRSDCLRRPGHREQGERRDRGGAGRGSGRRAGSVATRHRFRLASQGAPGRQVGRACDAEALPLARGLGRPRARRGDAGRRADRGREHRSGGGDLPHRALRGRGRSVRYRR